MKLQKALELVDKDRLNNKLGIEKLIFHVVDEALCYESEDRLFDLCGLDDLLSDKWYVICG